MMSKFIKASFLAFAVLAFGVQAKAQEEIAAPAEAAPAAPVTVSGDVGVVSHYIWRGVDQNGRIPSIQGGLSLGFAAVEGLSVGYWSASIGGNTGHETDYFITYGGTAGDLEYSVGWTLYSYDFTRFTTDAAGKNVAGQNEYSAGVSMAGASFNFFMVPAENSTKGVGDTADAVSLTWIELGYSTEALGLGLSANYGTGTYNQQWLNAGNAVESTAVLTVAVEKSIGDNIALSYNKTKIMTQSSNGAPLSGEYWMGLDVTF
ncbi:MAG: hypothetical protein A2516_02000 [Alphaproteobacteria bacterium RIFOXYD12_FULL_60_8]|nr:MAG: hypothetical protein A2516_02000 [Alphaproteobacteria bacterium RIFOXYD12_FULL_60_8]